MNKGENMNWKKLYNETKKYVNEQDISAFVHIGQVASGIVTDKGNMYFGICVDGKCDWGTCAERNAIMEMLKHGEAKVTHVVTVDRNGEIRMPCGLCREAFMQLHPDNKNIEFLVNLETRETIKLHELLPDWWGEDRF